MAANPGTELVDALAPVLADTLIALDFDGTLAPIVGDPSTSRPVPGTVETLSRLAGRGAQLAVITGRDARTVLELGDLDQVPGLIVEGLYGAETWADGVLTTPATPPVIERLRRQLPGVLRTAGAEPAVWIEDKRLSLVVHGRLAADPEAALAGLRRPVAELANRLGLETHPGRGVIELRLPGFDKGSALLRLDARAARRHVLFAGDDRGDLPAFAVLDELHSAGRDCWSLAVATAEAPEVMAAARLLVPDPVELVALLTRLADAAC